MAEMEGKLISCDHCGLQVFLKYKGEKNDTITDGGWTRIKHYDSMPDGWGKFGERPLEYSNICPKCKELWIAHLKSFLVTGVKFGGDNNA